MCAWSIAYRPPADSGSSPIVGDKYVGAGGSNSNAGTFGAPYATIAFAMAQIAAGQTVVVLDNITENLNITTLSGGSAGVYKRLAGITPAKVVTGTHEGGAANKYIIFQNLHFAIGANEADVTAATFLKYIACGFFGGPLGGNTSTHLAGSNQLYESCWFGGLGGRYASLCFNQTNTLYRWCVVRTDTWGSPANDGNPNGGIQIYSSTNCARVQCIGVDCLPQRSNNEFLAAFPVTSNVGPATGILDQGCIAMDNDTMGWQSEGSSNITHTLNDCVSVRNDWGYVKNLDNGGTITINGGEYSANVNAGIAGFNSGSVGVTNVNTTGNGGGNFNGVSAGAGCTTNAMNNNVRLSAMKKIGAPGTLRGEAGWLDTQVENLFPFPYEDTIRAFYATISTRGFCGGSFTLTTYLKR